MLIYHGSVDRIEKPEFDMTGLKVLAERANMTVSQLQRIEYGERKVENLSLKTAIALATALGVDVEEME